MVNLTRPHDKKLLLNKMTEVVTEGQKTYHLLDNSPEAFKNYLDVLYRVRCNLFHCEKSPASKRDKLIVECSFKTLSLLMTLLKNTYFFNFCTRKLLLFRCVFS